MGKTIIEKILGNHAGRAVSAGDMVDITIDARVARDFGGANVVKNIRDNGLGIADPQRTFFTFDCNPGGSDQKYAANQQLCRLFAREQGIQVYDVDSGIGTHIAIDAGLIGPGETIVSTDSHANIMGAIGAFGQGMGDQDIAHAFAFGNVWFKVPPTMRVRLEGQPAANATAKDVTLALVKHFGANGLLGYAAELYGPYVDQLDLPSRVTISSMCTEMGGIIVLFPPNQAVLDYCTQATGRTIKPVYADDDATYAKEDTVDISGLGPMLARPGHPDDVQPVAEAAGTKIDSVFIGSCTNGRYEDLKAAARVLEGNRIAPGVVLKIVPATDAVWQKLLEDGTLTVFKHAGALIGNAGCAGCAAGQIGQNGPGEVTVSTGNRNFPGKQGKGSVYLASPETAAASAIAGVIAPADAIPAEPVRFEKPTPAEKGTAARAEARGSSEQTAAERPAQVKGRVWVIRQDNIDTDMIYHNRYLTVTDPAEMGQYALDNLAGWEDFAKKCKPGDIIITGKNFGCGSSRQQAVDCFKTLGVVALVAESFGAIYERNAINAGMPIMSVPATGSDLKDGEEVEVDFRTGTVRRQSGEQIQGTAFSETQLAIYQRGGLLAGRRT
ncbi:MAG: 3-isopropylmalate dehydratase large subunit [Phycisphaerae bacterium]|nr:3-isopropylmalate dehydratase large subunit [Phycisphaerae bacterium]